MLAEAPLPHVNALPVVVLHIFILLPAMLLTMKMWLRCTSAALACAAAVSSCNNRMKQSIIFAYFEKGGDWLCAVCARACVCVTGCVCLRVCVAGVCARVCVCV